MFQTDDSPRELSSVADGAPAAAAAQAASRPVGACSNHSSGSRRSTTPQNGSAVRLASYSAEGASWLSKACPARRCLARQGMVGQGAGEADRVEAPEQVAWIGPGSASVRGLVKEVRVERRHGRWRRCESGRASCSASKRPLSTATTTVDKPRKPPAMRGAAAGADGLRPRRMSSHPVDTSRALVARCLEFVTKDASSRKKASADLLTNR